MSGGAAVATTNATFDEEALVSEYVSKFEQKTYSDAETGDSITYSVFLPESYDASKSYPMVVFIADSSCAGKDAEQSLSQGLGALVWASGEWQAENECIVVVPSYPETILDDHNGYTTTEYVELTKRLIESVSHGSVDGLHDHAHLGIRIPRSVRSVHVRRRPMGHLDAQRT